MPRLARLRLAGVPFHLVQRGNNRCACFLSDGDRLRYLDELTLLARSERVAVHAYVLMTNHVHLLATAEDDDGLSRMMKQLGQRYVQYFNRAHARSGSLWEGRFHSCLIDSEAYLLTCHRYIECNPVRAGMVSDPAEYRWSSYRFNALGQSDRLVSPHSALESLGETGEDRQTAYQAMFETDLTPSEISEIRAVTRGGFVLGSDRFKLAIAKRFERRVARIGSGRKMTKEKGSVPF